VGPAAAVVVFVICVGHVSSPAQDDVIARARAAASDGRRPEAIALLEAHLAKTPADVDARLVYGLILSWEGRYDEARKALQDVLVQAPDYLDARVALMNVEWWSGNTDAARAQVEEVLTRDPGNTQARHVRKVLDARTRPWNAGVWYTNDTFSDDRDAWNEVQLSLARETPIGTAIVRGNFADRFDLTDQQIEFEFYPRFRPGTYAFVAIGLAPDEVLYPGNRLSLELYQSLGRGYEVSVGYRRLAFTEVTDIYVASLTKYIGNWMLTGKLSLVPDDQTGTSSTYQGQARRYFGSTGLSYVGAAYSHGLSREEPRGAGDLVGLDADTFRVQGEVDLSAVYRISFAASTSRQELVSNGSLWQNTLSAGLNVRF
jgi:YaiO family outer membrane protein